MKKGIENLLPPSEEPRNPIASPAWTSLFRTCRDLGKHVWRSSHQHDILGRAAQLGFYFLLSLFPALLCVSALIGMLPLQSVLPQMMMYFQKMMPHESLSVLDTYLQQISQNSGRGIFSLSLGAALFAASWGMIAIINTLNTVYNVKETRPMWKVGFIALLLTIGAALFLISSMVLILAGENLSQQMADALGFNWLASYGWTLLQWPVAFLLMLLATSLIYYWGPNITHKWRWLIPGSVFAVLLWVFISLVFKLYVEKLMYYNLVYGSITGVIVLMIWLYFTGMVLLIGGEVNGVLELKKFNAPKPVGGLDHQEKAVKIEY